MPPIRSKSTSSVKLNEDSRFSQCSKPPEWSIRYLTPNSAGRISVKLEHCIRPTWIGFSLSLQEVLSYRLFKAEASRMIESPFTYGPAEEDPTGCLWLLHLQEKCRYPDRKLTDLWGEHCPGSTRMARVAS